MQKATPFRSKSNQKLGEDVDVSLLSEVAGCDLDQAANILHRYGHIAGLHSIGPGSLFELNCEQEQKVLRSLELGRRIERPQTHSPGPFRTSEEVFRFFSERWSRERVEVVWVLMLDPRLHLIKYVEISRGSVNGAVVHPREVLCPVILNQAAAFILVHNHPSGNPAPSREDYIITRSIKQSADIVQVDFLDHVILGHGRFFSFSDQRKI